MEIPSTFETKVTLTAKDLSKDIDNIDDLLEEKIKTQYEGKCSRNGYVLPNSVKLLSRSIGLVEKGRFTGDILYYAQAESRVLQPPDGFVLEGEVIRKNKMGMYVNYKDAIRVMVPRDLHIGDEEFDKVQVGEIVQVELKKSRYQVNDTSILSVGVYRGRAERGEGLEGVAKEVPVAEKAAFIFATKPAEEEEKQEEKEEQQEQPAKESEEEKKEEAEEALGAAAPGVVATDANLIRFTSTSPTFKEFSTVWPSKITINEKTYPTVEHYYQAMKFTVNPDYQDQIRAAKTGAAARKLGSTQVMPTRADWDDVKEDIMRDGLRAKFTQNAGLKKLLLSTGNKKLEDGSPTDSYWGIGKSGKGKNRLGMLLMELRDELSAETGPEGEGEEK